MDKLRENVSPPKKPKMIEMRSQSVKSNSSDGSDLLPLMAEAHGGLVLPMNPSSLLLLREGFKPQDLDDSDEFMSEISDLSQKISEEEDEAKFKEHVLRFMKKMPAIKMWRIRKELKRLKKDKKYSTFGDISPVAADLMYEIFCRKLE